MLHKIITPAASLLLICAVVVGAQTLTDPTTTTATATTQPGPETVIWESTLEAASMNGDRTIGFREGSAGSLSDTTITYNDVEYTVDILFTYNNSIRVAIVDKKPDLRTTLLTDIPNGVLSITSVSDPTSTFSGTITTSVLGPNTIDFRWPIADSFALTAGERYQVRLTNPVVTPTSTTSTTVQATTTTTADEESGWQPIIEISRVQRHPQWVYSRPNSNSQRSGHHYLPGMRYMPEYLYEAVLLNPRESANVEISVVVAPPSGHRRITYVEFYNYSGSSDNNYHSTFGYLNFEIHSSDYGTDLRSHMSLRYCTVGGDHGYALDSYSDELIDGIQRHRTTDLRFVSKHRPWETPDAESTITQCSLVIAE